MTVILIPGPLTSFFLSAAFQRCLQVVLCSHVTFKVTLWLELIMLLLKVPTTYILFVNKNLYKSKSEVFAWMDTTRGTWERLLWHNWPFKPWWDRTQLKGFHKRPGRNCSFLSLLMKGSTFAFLSFHTVLVLFVLHWILNLFIHLYWEQINVIEVIPIGQNSSFAEQT